MRFPPRLLAPPPFFVVRTERPEMFEEVRLLGTDSWHSLRWVWKGLPGKSILFLGLKSNSLKTDDTCWWSTGFPQCRRRNLSFVNKGAKERVISQLVDSMGWSLKMEKHMEIWPVVWVLSGALRPTSERGHNQPAEAELYPEEQVCLGDQPPLCQMPLLLLILGS